MEVFSSVDNYLQLQKDTNQYNYMITENKPECINANILVVTILNVVLEEISFDIVKNKQLFFNDSSYCHGTDYCEW